MSRFKKLVEDVLCEMDNHQEKDTKTSNKSCKENSNVFRYKNLIEDSVLGHRTSYYDDETGEDYGPHVPDEELWFVVVTGGIVDYVDGWIFDKKASEETLPFDVDKYLKEHKNELGKYNDCLWISTSLIDTVETGIGAPEESYEEADKEYDEIAKLNPRAKLALMGFSNRYDGMWRPID